jgi:uncharacterized protein (DUF362 family)/Pyruvate/2-oxoacid:ferredoxin oxidoreductase delta subunit
MKTLVSIRTCRDYEKNRIHKSIERLFDDLGGIKGYISRGERVLLKPNLLKGADEALAIVTHPSIVEGVAECLVDIGAKPFIGDSPPLGHLNRVLSKSGYDPFIKRLGLQVVPFKQKATFEFPANRIFKKIDLAHEVFQFDKVVNLPKLKTHTQMLMSLAVKNLFGTVIGTDKASWHLAAGKDYDMFATVLVQIYEKIRPVISIIDGVLGMEGNGPNSGNPRKIGVIGGSSDAIALDSTICSLVGLRPDRLRTCVIGKHLGLGEYEPSAIELLGDDLQDFPLKDFKTPKSVTMAWNLGYWNPVRRFMENHMITKPVIDSRACKNCGICLDHCPPQAISNINGVTRIDRRLCISCFCCHELCSNKAVKITRPFFGKLFSSISR